MSAAPGDAADVSVVVPTRDRPRELERCLAALEPTPELLEVVVVDDGSRDADAVAAVAAGAGARLVRRDGRGVSAARNAGARAARGSIVCFTDDDCVACDGWAARLAAAIRGGADVAAGPTRNGRHGDALAAASQIASNALAHRADGTLLAPPGSNLGARVAVCLEVPFDESWAVAEDREWFARLGARSHSVAFAPDAVVEHHQRLTLPGLWRKHSRYGRGAHRFRHTHTDGRLEPPSFYARLLREGFREGAAVGAGLCVAQAATAVGYALEALRA